MNMKLAGVAFGALMIGVMAGGVAKADVTAYADLDITSALLSGDVALDNVNINNSFGANTQFGPNGTMPTVANPVIVGTTATASQGTASNGATSVSTFSGTLLDTVHGVASDTNSAITLLNGYQALQNTTSASSGTDSSFRFTASTTGVISLTLNGSYTTYAAQSNSNSLSQTAHATVDFKIDISNTTAGATQQDQSYDLISSNKSAGGTTASSGSLTAVSFSDLVQDFTLLAGDTYELTITQTAGTYGTAVPEPGTLALFGAGLAGLGLFGFRRQKKTGSLAA